MEDKPKYVKCPRCELNYILSHQDYCEVCKQEMKAGYQDEVELDEVLLEEEGSLCPICKLNYISDESKGMCDSCYEENATMNEGNDDNVDWRTFVDKDSSDDDELDLLPVDPDDEIDEELGNTFAKDLDGEFDDNYDEEDEDFGSDFDDDDDFDDTSFDDSIDDDEEDEDNFDDDDDDDDDELGR